MSAGKLRDYLKMPPAGEGTRIGLFGGSFNPPHEGHLNVCDLAFKRIGLDHIWWMVTPGNPLKNTSDLPGLMERIQQCEALITDPRIKVTAFEASLNTRFTADTVSLVKQFRPKQKFVWVMGADNLENFHQWQNWQKIASTFPMAIIDRPGSTLSIRSARAALALSRYRVDENRAVTLPDRTPPAWTFIHGPRTALSSTMLRSNKSK